MFSGVFQAVELLFLYSNCVSRALHSKKKKTRVESIIDFTTDFKSVVKSRHDFTVKSSALDLRLILLSNQLRINDSFDAFFHCVELHVVRLALSHPLIRLHLAPILCATNKCTCLCSIPRTACTGDSWYCTQVHGPMTSIIGELAAITRHMNDLHREKKNICICCNNECNELHATFIFYKM